MAEPLKILIVDDSRIFRAVLQGALEAIPGVKVVGSVWNGAKALEFLQSQSVDLVTLDVEMPTMDGLATLREIQRLTASGALASPVACLLLSAHTAHGAEVTVEGLEAGAFDFITKPAGDDPEQAASILRDELTSKIQWLRLRRKPTTASGGGKEPPAHPRPAESASPRMIRAVCIVASTGGPQALASLLPPLTVGCQTPIFIVQHMPVGFTSYLAESLAKRCSRPVREARDGETAVPGGVYLAPGGKHMLLRNRGGETGIFLNEQPPVNGCRPAGDVLLRSAASVFASQAVGVVLTGMGQDGAQGLLSMRRAGAATIAQDEATSVVWGMPGAAAALRAAERILPLDQIAGYIASLTTRGPERRGS
jgi:two-component system chemotaxis response regulator CheB